MYPVLFSVGPVKVFSYGALVAFSFFVAYLYVCRLARKIDVDEDYITDIFLVIIVSSIVGARLNYVVTHPARYLAHPGEIVKIWGGGMVYLGGFIGAVLGAILYLKIRGFEFGKFADMFGPAVPLAQAVGRLGCFMNGCCFGLVCEPPWGVRFPYHPPPQRTYLPTQLIEVVILLGIFYVLHRFYQRNRVPGRVMVGYLYLYSLERFLIEFVRYESVEESYLFGLTLAQSTCLVMIIPVVLYHLYIERTKPADPSGTAAT